MSASAPQALFAGRVGVGHAANLMMCLALLLSPACARAPAARAPTALRPDPTPATRAPEPAPTRADSFDLGATAEALGAATRAARGCKTEGGPTGVGRVKITFAPGGSVTSASLDGPPFAGTAVGDCIVQAFRGVHVPAFEGGPINVSKAVAID